MREHKARAPLRALASKGETQALTELVGYLRQARDELSEDWARRITEAGLLGSMDRKELVAEVTLAYDEYLEALDAGTEEAFRACAQQLLERITPWDVESHELLGIVQWLHDTLTRSLSARYHRDLKHLNRVVDVYEPAANRIASMVAAGLLQEREGTIRQQQETIRALSMPVLQLGERLLGLPIIGAVDAARVRYLTEQLLQEIRVHRAKIVVVDFAGVAAMESDVTSQVVQMVEAARLMGATMIVTGLSSAVAQTLVNIGVDLEKMHVVGDLRGGIEEGQRLLGYQVLALGRLEAREVGTV